MTANDPALAAQHHGGVQLTSECRRVSCHASQCKSVLEVLIHSSSVKLIHGRVRWAMACSHRATAKCDSQHSHSRRMLQAMTLESDNKLNKFVLSKAHKRERVWFVTAQVNASSLLYVCCYLSWVLYASWWVCDISRATTAQLVYFGGYRCKIT